MVETYLIEDADRLIANVDGDLDQWNKIVQEAELSGQQTLSQNGVIPFQPLNTEAKTVYSILCPSKAEVALYSRSTIPLRVLNLVALCKKEGYFQKMWVWSDDTKPDPVVVGSTTGNEYDTNSMYLVARWGDELRSYHELRKIAVERKSRELKTVAMEEKQRSELILASPEDAAERFIQRGW